MTLIIPPELMRQLRTHAESSYPEEGAGLLMGLVDGESRVVNAVYELSNARESGARHNRYLITPHDMLRAEDEAAQRGMEVLGVFHSHPDHPNRPSDFDRQWAMPWFSYLITSVESGRATGSRSWRLMEDRGSYFEEQIESKTPGALPRMKTSSTGESAEI